MVKRKIEILTLIEKYDAIKQLFGSDFIKECIDTYKVNEKQEWSPNNFFISNYLMSASFHFNEPNFITELNNMSRYFLENHSEFIYSEVTLTRLKSKDKFLFNGKWSEMIFAYYLTLRGVKVLDISRIIPTNEGEIELFDILSELGSIEVTTILSEKGKSFIDGEVFSGDLSIGSIEKELVNKKIKKKSGNNLIAIDCTFVDELFSRIVESNSGFNIDYNVFKNKSKTVILFIRHPYTQQVGGVKFLN